MGTHIDSLSMIMVTLLHMHHLSVPSLYYIYITLIRSALKLWTYCWSILIELPHSSSIYCQPHISGSIDYSVSVPPVELYLNDTHVNHYQWRLIPCCQVIISLDYSISIETFSFISIYLTMIDMSQYISHKERWMVQQTGSPFTLLLLRLQISSSPDTNALT